MREQMATQRKQDYEFDHMLKANKAYKEYMHEVEGVKVIDCDQPQDVVLKQVVKVIANNG